MVDYEYDITIGIIIGIAVLLFILAIVFDKFFPKNKISKMFEKWAEWIRDNVNI